MTTGERHFNEVDNPPLPASQDTNDRRGKIYRFTLEGKPAPGNPDFGRGAPPGLFATGVRSPQGLAQDIESGRVWFTDHGAVGGDELNLLAAGANYGWPVRTQGRYSNPDFRPIRTLGEVSYRDPVYGWGDHIVAPSGILFYTGSAFPEWRGDLLVAGITYGNLMRIDLEGERVRAVDFLIVDDPVRLRGVEQAPDGTLYLLTDEQDGKLIRVDRGRYP